MSERFSAATDTLVAVAVQAPLRRLFHYRWPADWPNADGLCGIRVLVPFGRGERVGVLIAVVTQGAVAPARIKTVHARIDAQPLLSADDLALALWAARYYRHPPGEVLAASFAPTLRQARLATSREVSIYRLTAAGQAALGSHRAPQQVRVAALLHDHGDGLSAAELVAAGGSREALRTLLSKGWVEVCPSAPRRPKVSSPELRGVVLSDEQATAATSVRAALGRFAVFLLHGVTGSGKTEVYLDVIAATRARGQQTLLLLPEIGLTPQLEARYRERIGGELALSHSGLPPAQRTATWCAAQRGEVAVLLGTRSAIFTPMPRLGLIVLDEEHDPSYKQQEGFRFSARDYAVMRARRLGIPVVLGSATPSLETLYNVEQGRYQRLVLGRRSGGAALPAVQFIDIRNQYLDEGLSPRLVEALRNVVARHEQALLFLNRRGYAPLLTCHTCGWVAECTRCAASMVIHREDARLCCHHCGREVVPPAHCPSCGGAQLQALGLGTERVEQALARQFPAARLARVDRDAMRRKHALTEVLSAAVEGRIDILLGTQMLAKGHHFPNVTLAAIVDADSGLFSLDFRAGERLAQLLTQVAGRAGRAEKPGNVLVQTRHPDHPLLQAWLRGGFDGFAAQEMRERQAAGLPPFGCQALLRCSSVRSEHGERFASAAAALARVGQPRVEVLGPVPAPMARRAGQYRWQLLLQSGRRAELQAALDHCVPAWEALEEARDVRWSVDVDPLDLY